jgi:hypothetical protein
VLDWELRRSTPDFTPPAAGSRQQALLVATFVQLENPIAPAVWAGVEPGHRRVVRYVLERAGRRIREKESDG